METFLWNVGLKLVKSHSTYNEPFYFQSPSEAEANILKRIFETLTVSFEEPRNDVFKTLTGFLTR